MGWFSKMEKQNHTSEKKSLLGSLLSPLPALAVKKTYQFRPRENKIAKNKSSEIPRASGPPPLPKSAIEMRACVCVSFLKSMPHLVRVRKKKTTLPLKEPEEDLAREAMRFFSIIFDLPRFFFLERLLSHLGGNRMAIFLFF